jgi:hypothetical protein
MEMKTPESNSPLLKRVLIELPHYSYSHSTADAGARREFVGRRDILRRFTEQIRDAGDRVGVYLVTGNRGVGKTKLIDAVEKETSFDVGVIERIKHLFVLFCAVAGAQVCLSGKILEPFVSFVWKIFLSADPATAVGGGVVTGLRYAVYALCPLSFIALCYLNEFRRCGGGLLSLRFLSVYKELLFFGWKTGSYRNARYLLRVAFIVGLSQVVPAAVLKFWGVAVTPVKAFLICLVIGLFGYLLVRGADDLCRFMREQAGDSGLKGSGGFWRWFRERVCGRLGNVVEGHNRIYVRINFGHALKDEKDILRLISRTLLAEYRKYHRSFWRLLVWRLIAVVFLFLLADMGGDVLRSTGVWDSVRSWVMDPVAPQSESDYAARIRHVNTKAGDSAADMEIGDKQIYVVKGFFGVAWVKRFIRHTDNVVTKVSRKAETLPKFLCNGEAEARDGGPDYPFWLSFVVLYAGFVSVFRTRWLSRYFVTHRMILGRLRELNGDITHSTELERSLTIQGGPDAGAKIGGKVKRVRGLADAREIERVLQDIFQDVRRIPAVMGRPKFVVVFDELDKVEPGDAEAAGVSQVAKAALFSIDAARKRQTEILKIMSNMKYFLSTSEAKFVFIAGREMYDIYLADVSDRNNYIGSIFSAVIEVPSFLTDHAEGSAKSNMTALTEEFVCRRLLPLDYQVKDGEYNLETYRKYLEDRVFGKKRNSAREPEIRKVIAVLEHFVVYLAHVSKGAPKKIVQLFELFINVLNVDEMVYGKEFRDGKPIVAQCYRRSKFFLRFGYYRQYTLGLIAYLITPIFYRLAERNISWHNDKLLISSLRFVDFVFKFHKHSFMWKHLDISPEMLEVNKAPELRSITVDLLNYMLQTHVTKSNFSLFDYRFDSRIANEIFAAASIDEVISALFSFSLDEMLPLKKHYQDLLAETHKRYRKDKRFSSADFIDSISALQIVLGDLHYFDGELEEAGIYYRDAIEALRKFGSRDEDEKNKEDNPSKDTVPPVARRKGSESREPEQLYLFVRNMLKVGLTYETRKLYEQAYLIYGEVCTRIVRERDIAIRELGVGVAIRKDDDGRAVFVKTWLIKGDVGEKKNNDEKKNNGENGNIDRREEMYNDHVECPPVGNNAEKEKVKREIAQPRPLYFQKLSPNTNDTLFRKVTYEGLKLLYLPFLVKLQILEKSHKGGISRTHLEQFDKELDHLTFIIDHEEANILKADFCSRAADILYYKHADLKGKKREKRIVEDNDDKYVEYEKKQVENKNGADKTDEADDGKIENCSCTACYYYHQALSMLLNKDEKGREPYMKIENMSSMNADEISGAKKEQIKRIKQNNGMINLLYDCFEKLNDRYYNMKFCAVLARLLSDWGNVFVGCDKCYNVTGEEDNACYIGDDRIGNTGCPNRRSDLADGCFEYVCGNLINVESEKDASEKSGRDKIVDILQNKERTFSKMEIAFAMYALSFHAFHRFGKHKRAVFQVYKMLRLFKNYEFRDCDDYVEKLSERAIGVLWLAADELNAMELNKTSKDLGKKSVADEKTLKYLLVDSDATVIAVLRNEMRLLLDVMKGKDTKKRVDTLNELRDLDVASSYGLMFSMSARIFQLRLKVDINYETYRILVPEDKFDKDGKIKEELDSFLSGEGGDARIEDFGVERKAAKDFFSELVSESVFCLKETVRLSKTLGEAYLFNHFFIGETHRKLSFWTARYEEIRHSGEKNKDLLKRMRKHLKELLEDGWEEQLSSQYERKLALEHYHRCLEMHTEGKAYHTMIEGMCFVKDDYNDRSDHFSIAVERYKIENKLVEKHIEKLRRGWDEYWWYKAENYI